MSFLNRLERHCPWLAIPGLIRYVALLNALVFTLHFIAPGYLSMLTLNREAILHGQAWRLITWIFIPQTLSPFWILFALLFLWYLGDGIEQSLGAFRTTVFYLTGIIGCTAAALIFGGDEANTFLNLSLLYAFATLHPDYKVFFLFFIPLRIAWLAVISAVLSIVSAVSQSPSAQAALLVSLLNFFLFFWPELLLKWREFRLRRGATYSLPRNPKKSEEPLQSLHCCTACGRTELSNPELSFRVTQSGEDYCLEHLPSRS